MVADNHKENLYRPLHHHLRVRHHFRISAAIILALAVLAIIAIYLSLNSF